jgi:radical SAM/Cys-rich protein
MHAMMPLLAATDFPRIRRYKLEVLQVNLGYKCNQACFHCHVNAGPTRTEMMDRTTVDLVLQYARTARVKTLDITGGAPELNSNFRYLVSAARALNLTVIDRCNLTVLEEADQADTAEFLAQQQVEITASLPCYLEQNVDAQRGDGVFQKSLDALRRLNTLGYGLTGSGLVLNLVYNPQGPSLPPDQAKLEIDYKRELKQRYGIDFNRLFTITNMPIARFGSTLVSKNQFQGYMQLLKDSYAADNLEQVMCRNLLSIDYQGYVYDCDFNQMLGISLALAGKSKTHLRDLLLHNAGGLDGNPIAVADHCYGCTAGRGSSCGGALNSNNH